MIHCELCKRLDFDRSAKWYIHKLEPFRENETYEQR